MPTIRTAFLLLAAPLAFSVPASADPTVPGCWGAGPATYCNATISVRTAGTENEPTPVCAGSCVYVGVPSPRTNEAGAEVCLTYTTPQGYPAVDCYGQIVPVQEWAEAGLQAFCENHPGKPPAWCGA